MQKRTLNPENAPKPNLEVVLINPRKEPLTPEKLRELSGNQTLSEAEAGSIIETINQLARIFLEATRRNNPYCIDNQLYVSLSTDENPAFYSLIKNKAA